MPKIDIRSYPAPLAPYQELIAEPFDTAVSVHTRASIWPGRSRRITEVILVSGSARVAAEDEARRMRRSRWISTGIVAGVVSLAQGLIWLFAWRSGALSEATVDAQVVVTLLAAGVTVSALAVPRSRHRLPGWPLTRVLGHSAAMRLSYRLDAVSRDHLVQLADSDPVGFETEVKHLAHHRSRSGADHEGPDGAMGTEQSSAEPTRGIDDDELVPVPPPPASSSLPAEATRPDHPDQR